MSRRARGTGTVTYDAHARRWRALLPGMLGRGQIGSYRTREAASLALDAAMGGHRARKLRHACSFCGELGHTAPTCEGLATWRRERSKGAA